MRYTNPGLLCFTLPCCRWRCCRYASVALRLLARSWRPRRTAAVTRLRRQSAGVWWQLAATLGIRARTFLCRKYLSLVVRQQVFTALTWPVLYPVLSSCHAAIQSFVILGHCTGLSDLFHSCISAYRRPLGAIVIIIEMWLDLLYIWHYAWAHVRYGRPNGWADRDETWHMASYWPMECSRQGRGQGLVRVP